MKKIAGFAMLSLVLFGCAAETGSEQGQESASAESTGDQTAAGHEEVGSSASAIGVGCDPKLPLCSCVLKGSPGCADDDGDGVINMYDNCDQVKNPIPAGHTTQPDCDGDGIGDACDHENWKVTSRGSERYFGGKAYTGKHACERDEGVFSIRYDEVDIEEGTQDYEMRIVCFDPLSDGHTPQKFPTVKHPGHHKCWETNVTACDFTAPGWDDVGQICH